jgi:serine/threonine protein kinase
MTQLSTGQSLASRFTLIRRLGSGGMGDVWLARDEELGTELVAKIVPADASPDQIALLRQECLHSRRLAHPNIVRVFDFHQDPAASFITMEYIDGRDLCDLRGASTGQIIQSVLPVVDALEHAHREGVVHRDIKCSNVLVDSAGRPRLSDFGIAGLASPGPGDLQVVGGGSGHHASPQQRAGQAATPADDIYGMGVMLRELLGSRSLPGGLAELTSKMTANSVEDRPADLSAVREALQKYARLDEAPTMPPSIAREKIRLAPPPRVPAVRQSEPRIAHSTQPAGDTVSQRHPYWWLTVAAFGLLALVLLAVFVVLPDWVEQRGEAEVAQQGPQVASSERPVAETSQGSEALELPATAAAETMAEPALEPEQPGPEAQLPEVAAVEEVEPEPEQRPTSKTGRPRESSVATPTQKRSDPTAEAFAEVMTDGLSALDAGAFESAEEKFQRALSLMPGSTEAADGLARAQLALRLAAITRHRERAAALEQEERWREAESEYASALALDSTLRFAQDGKVRTGSRAALTEEMAYHIAHPERLIEDRVLAEAQGLLADAEAVDSLTPGLRNQIAELRRVVEVASTPVEVVLESDSATEVVVYRVGRLGRFERRELELRPGTYTVVGTREGYRDVRRQLKVEPGGQSQPLKVWCEEKI